MEHGAWRRGQRAGNIRKDAVRVARGEAVAARYAAPGEGR
jgi:hypothetical protein